VSPAVRPGKYTLGVEFTREKAGKHGESLAKVKLYVNDKVVAQGDMKLRRASLRCPGMGSASVGAAGMPSVRTMRLLERSREAAFCSSVSRSRRLSTSIWSISRRRPSLSIDPKEGGATGT
jgi:hypothetical protein